MKYLGAIYGIVGLALFAALAFVAFKLWRFFDAKGGGAGAVIGAGNWLKEDTILGAPARGIDAGISVAAGREETLGGQLAEWFDPTTKAAQKFIQAGRNIKPVSGTPAETLRTKEIVNGSLPSPYSINPRDRN